MASARFSTKGQIVIPKELRDMFALTAGSEVELFVEADGIKLRAKAPDGIRRTTLSEVSGMLAGRYTGPPLLDDEIQKRLTDAARAKWQAEMGKDL